MIQRRLAGILPPGLLLSHRRHNATGRAEVTASGPTSLTTKHVVVIGGGATGCLTALLLRRRFDANRAPFTDLKITVIDRAGYPGGKVGGGLPWSADGSDSDESLRWNDSGAQMLSVVDAGGGHPNSLQESHGVT